MPETPRISLDDPAFRGRLRLPRDTARTEITAKTRPSAKYFSQSIDQQFTPRERPETVESLMPVWAKPMAGPAAPTQEVPEPAAPTLPVPTEPEQITRDEPEANPVTAERGHTSSFRDSRQVSRPRKSSFHRPRPHKPNYSRLQWTLVVAAGFVFIVGAMVSLQGILTNHNVTSQVAALSKKSGSSGSSNNNVPSTTKPSTNAFSRYMVAPDLPRYITIPKLGVNARVLQTGVTSSGALGTPSNVFDTAWYTGSAKPGQPGATLIDGHVSSWTTHGVFYGLKSLVAGDQIQIQRGDGQILTYQVVKSQTYTDNEVDMQAAMTPVVAGKSGLNLITCTGQVKPGTSEFNQRVIVFTEQI
jgi:sortase A